MTFCLGFDFLDSELPSMLEFSSKPPNLGAGEKKQYKMLWKVKVNACSGIEHSA